MSRVDQIDGSEIARVLEWWSDKLSELRKLGRKLFNKAKWIGNWEEYKLDLTSYNREISSAKRNNFLFSSILWYRFSIPEATRLHKAQARRKTQRVMAIRLPAETFTIRAENRASADMLTIFSETVMDDQTPPGVENKSFRSDWVIKKSLLTTDSIMWALASLRVGFPLPRSRWHFSNTSTTGMTYCCILSERVKSENTLCNIVQKGFTPFSTLWWNKHV